MDMKWFLFSFEGRINRKPFWLYALAMMVAFTVLGAFTVDLQSGEPSTAMVIFALVTLWTNLAVQAKRWHDTDRSAWWILIGLVPLIGGIWALVVTGFFRGTPGDNRFGPDPLA
jgi:uncharacterized membrane protein YhaH (DUF805 family)